MSSDFEFARSRRFAPLFGTQFLGAFNDNLFKTTLFVLISFQGLGQETQISSVQLLNLGALLFVLPFFLFSALSGQLATRYNKARLAQATKLLEVLIMAAAAYGFAVRSAPLLLLCLFMMGAQSALFGPVKYAVLPEYLRAKELLMGNGLIESGTFLAILLGQIIGTAIAGMSSWLLAVMVLCVAVAGLLCSLGMPSVAARNRQLRMDWHIVRSTKELLFQAAAERELFTAIIGISWFWFVGAVYTTQLPNFVRLHLGGNEAVFNLMLGLFSVGIALGSIACGKLCRGVLKLWLVLLGALGLAVSGGLLAYFSYGWTLSGSLWGVGAFLQQPHAYPIVLVMLGIGFFGGFFSVPLYTWLQTVASDSFRAQAVAANNIVNSVFMVAAALISALLLFLSDSIVLLYFLVALGNIPVAAYLFYRAPEIFWRR